MTKMKFRVIFMSLGVTFMVLGATLFFMDWRGQDSKDVPKSNVLNDFLKANQAYRDADERFWNFVDAEKKPSIPGRLNLEELKSLYSSYVKQLDSLNQKDAENQPWRWQFFNNRANAQVYQIFLAGALKENGTLTKKLAKSALDDYLTALEKCGLDENCKIFVGQNIDWLTRPPSAESNGKGDGQGLGNLFEGDEDSVGSGNMAEENNRPVPFYIPGASPGKSISGAH